MLRLMLQPIIELDRLRAHSPEPHAIAADGSTLWISSRETRQIDVVDPDGWRKLDELHPPGMPWGMAWGAGALVMTCGEAPDDTRRIRRYRPGHGFDESFIACPDDTGSHLSFDGSAVLLGQWYNKHILRLRDDGGVERVYDVPHEIAGIAAVDGAACVLGTDDEDAGEYWITRVDLREGAAEDVALVPFHARGLAWDGSRFWTNHRAAGQTVAFVLPA